jgi:predicted metal-dependent phosphoesterase TrpH
MPSRQPFTALCQSLGQPRSFGRADLHLHTTASDGTYRPEQVVELARHCGLVAVAITDHDTLCGVPSAQAAASSGLDVVPGVEITAEYRARELHLLGYFVRLTDERLQAALARLRSARDERFWELVRQLQGLGLALDEGELRRQAGNGVLGRRNLAELLVQQGRVGSVQEAFVRYLRDGGRAVAPKLRLPVAEAIALVRGAGGVAAWAHPSYDCDRAALVELRGLGLRAVEAEYPAHRPSWTRTLRGLATELDLAVTGGSDCHGPEPAERCVGARSITATELQRLRDFIPG